VSTPFAATEPAASPALDPAPVLAHVVRSGTVESVHHGTAVVTAADGSIAHAWGDPTGLVFPRSANKPLQALAMVELGLDLPGPQLALACASHSGEQLHLDTALKILHSAGLSESDLCNTPDYPYDEATKIGWLHDRKPMTSLAQNCSGKHAAMVVTSAAHGWSLPDYLDADHPLQRAIIATIERLAGPVGALAVDGCGAPLHGIPLAGLARAFGALASADPTSAPGRVATAMRDHPDYVGGSGRQVTRLMRALPGAMAKDGAEAVYAVGLADGRGIALKIADGAWRAAGVVLGAVLRAEGIGDETAWELLADAPVLGHGRPVGSVVAVGI